MKTQFTLSLFIVVLSVALWPASASSDSSKATVTPAASAEAQLAQASRLWQQMERTPPPQKMDLLAQALANLALVRRQWPNDKRAVARSGIMQADLSAEFGALPKAIDGLWEALPAASNTDLEPGVELRLGKAYEQLGNATEAEKHFLSAERTMRASHLNPVESHSILNNTGLFYSRQNKPSEAIRRFHEAQQLPGVSVAVKVSLQLSAVKEGGKLGKDVWAPEIAKFDELIVEAQHTSLSHGEASAIDDMQKDAKRVRGR
jgi:tetratricopeptide (TPR) repeat protein